MRVGEDFDFVVLGVGLGSIPFVAGELIDRAPAWRSMLTHCKTVATQAFQIWLRCDVEELGWEGPQVALSGFVEPFDTWADMHHVLDLEAWRDPPRTLAYFCNALPDPEGGPEYEDPGYPEEMRRRVRRNAVEFLNRDIGVLWPKSQVEGPRFRWELLAGGASEQGESRFDSQFWVANVSPSERYSLSLPGSLAHRISPLDRHFDNLTVAGDWTDCGFNEGCVEAAVMSGRLAAHAIAASPPLEEIVGYDHP